MRRPPPLFTPSPPRARAHRSRLVVALLVGASLGCSAAPTTATTTAAAASPQDAPDPVLAAPTSSREFVSQSESGSPLFAAASTSQAPIQAFTDPGELPRLLVVSRESAPSDDAALILEHTEVSAEVRGHVAQVRLRQRFQNDRQHPIEVRYVFPLPENSAVDDLRMRIGERVIESQIETRADAQARFETARQAGHTAALLEQERPNVFTQRVTNIAPGEAIEVEIQYLQTLTQDGGNYEFVFPMVVGPRFSPPGTTAAAHHSVSPPIAGKGQRSGHDVSLSLSVSAGGAVQRWESPTHTVAGQATADGFALRLADAQTLPNRDFVVRWQSTAAQPRASVYLGPVATSGASKGLGHFTLVVEPPQSDLDSLVGQREMIFVVDRSGSMSGQPLALAKQTLREALHRLRPVDTFNVIAFESQTGMLFEGAMPANEHNLVTAERFVDGLQPGGGTLMASAVEAALSPALSPGRHRYVFFLTDGFISNEDAIAREAASLVARAEAQSTAENGDLRARVFGLGIGSSPNRELLSSLSRAGRGADLYVSNREHPREAVESYYRYVDSAVLTDMRVDWGGLEVVDMFPSAGVLPDLYASHAVVWVGRYRSDPSDGQVLPVLHARVAGSAQDVDFPVGLTASGEGERVLSTLWAREQIADIQARHADGALDVHEVELQVTALGLSHHLVTAYTSLIAVDTSRVVGSGDPDQVDQVVELPEGVDGSMAVGSSSSRDFVSMIVVAPTVSRDSGRVSVMGTASVEQKYTIQSQGIQEFRSGLQSTSWAPVFRIRSVTAPEGVKAKRVRRALRERAGMFEACYKQNGVSGTHRFSLLLRFDASGELVDVEWLGRDVEGATGCIESVLGGVDWAPAQLSAVALDAAEVTVVLELR